MFPEIIPALYTTPSVVEKLLNGADLMVPGLLVPEGGLPALSKGTVVAICCPGNLAAHAIGILTFDTGSVKSVAGAKGKAVLVTHAYKDHLWGSGSKKELPVITPGDIGRDRMTDEIQSGLDNDNGAGSDAGNSVNTDNERAEIDEVSVSPAEMDELLFTTLKQAMATVLDQDNA
ncbi:Eukaryotic translation initiation factor 2D, partial [Coemansia sp. RSA 1933]